MSSLYPSLEDMKVDQMARAQVASQQQLSHEQSQVPYPLQPASCPEPAEKYFNLYPSLDEYMGLSISPEEVNRHIPNAVALPPPNQVVSSGGSQLVAPLSGASAGLMRAKVSHGIRELLLCKDEKGKIGLRVRDVNKGVFVVLVQANSPAALAGLRFGDQILMINEVTVAGYSISRVHDLIKKSSPERITMAVRDRPFERTITLHKDSTGHIGYGFKNGKVNTLVKDSSAARNGMLTEHNMLEVNGQNVVGLRDKDITKIIEGGGNIITVTVMPSFIFDHMMKHMADYLVKKTMDHSIPDI